MGSKCGPRCQGYILFRNKSEIQGKHPFSPHHMVPEKNETCFDTRELVWSDWVWNLRYTLLDPLVLFPSGGSWTDFEIPDSELTVLTGNCKIYLNFRKNHSTNFTLLLPSWSLLDRVMQSTVDYEVFLCQALSRSINLFWGSFLSSPKHTLKTALSQLICHSPQTMILNVTKLLLCLAFEVKMWAG